MLDRETAPVEPVAATPRFAWVDVLRGLSAFGVVLFHCRVDLYAGWNEIHAHPTGYSLFDRMGAYASLPLAFLGSGVMLFFVLSGFCVHYAYANRRKAFGGKEYAARRVLRIVPPYLAAVALTIVAELVAARISGAPTSDPGLIARSLLMIQNYGPHAGQMVGNPSLWSLPVEMELYAAYPLFLLLLWRFGAVKSLLVCGVVSLAACVAIPWTGSFPAGGFMPYWLMWCAGAVVAELVVSGKTIRWSAWWWVVGGLSLVAAAVFQVRNLDIMAQRYLWAGFYLCVIVFGLRSPSVSNWLGRISGKRLAAFGAITYSLYLVHFPLLRVMGAGWTWAFGAKPAILLVPILGALICIPFAFLFFRAFESPSHALSRKLGRKLQPVSEPANVRPKEA